MARGSGLAIAAAGTTIGRAGSRISMLRCCTKIRLLSRLGVSQSGLMRLETKMLLFLPRLRLLLQLVEHGRLPLLLLYGSLQHATTVFIKQEQEPPISWDLKLRALYMILLRERVRLERAEYESKKASELRAQKSLSS